MSIEFEKFLKSEKDKFCKTCPNKDINKNEFQIHIYRPKELQFICDPCEVCVIDDYIRKIRDLEIKQLFNCN